MKKLFFVCLTLISIEFLSCKGSQNSITHLFKENNVNIGKGKNVVFLISGNGCINCSKNLIALFEPYHNKSNTYHIVTSRSNEVNTSDFDTMESTIHVKSLSLQPYGIKDYASVIFLQNGKIDTLVTIDVNDYDRQNEFLYKKIKSYQLN